MLCVIYCSVVCYFFIFAATLVNKDVQIVPGFALGKVFLTRVPGFALGKVFLTRATATLRFSSHQQNAWRYVS